ncbi:MAG: hypothetical protein LBO73_01125, partial [Holosporaceae bacterium]|nr:hypothetical protein [Holosporaceae bacterium]
MRRFVVFLFVCVGTVSAMDHATDYALHYGMRDIAACFRQGLYRQAVGDAIKATKENVDNALASSCKLFLKEFYPLLLEEDATLIDFNDEIGNLLRGFVPERECSNYYRWM